MKRIFLISFCISILLSCEKEVDINIKTEPLIVVNSFLNPDSIIKVNISKGLNIFDTLNVLFVDNANIELLTDNQSLGFLKYDKDGNYLMNFKPVENKKYNLQVTVPGFAKCEASDIIPSKTNIISIDTASVYKNYTNVLECKINFLDNPETEDYYLLDIKAIAGYYIIQHSNNEDDNDTTYFEQSIDFETDDDFVEEKIESDNIMYGVIFSDKLINGKLNKITVDIDNNILQIKDKNVIKFYLKKISKDYYLYAKSYARYLNYDDELFGEPIQVYSNIKNGFGIFGGYNQDVDSIVYYR